jgi:hypothetical protein
MSSESEEVWGWESYYLDSNTIKDAKRAIKRAPAKLRKQGIKTLIDAMALLKKGWVKGFLHMARSSQEDVNRGLATGAGELVDSEVIEREPTHFCAVGATNEADGPGEDIALAALDIVAGDEYNYEIIELNDDKGTKLPKVLGAFKRAIKLLS